MANQEENNFGNLTPRARQILLLAKQEAERFNHDYIGTEHLLLGILALNEGVAVNVLKSLGLNLQQLRLHPAGTADAEQQHEIGAQRQQTLIIDTPVESDIGHRFGMAGGQFVVQFFGNAACGQQAGEKAKCRDTDRSVHRIGVFFRFSRISRGNLRFFGQRRR